MVETGLGPSLTILVSTVVDVHHLRARASIARVEHLVDGALGDQPELANMIHALFGELERHMRSEEGALFPAIRLLDKPGSSPAMRAQLRLSIAVHHHHGKLEKALRDLREASRRYTPPDGAAPDLVALYRELAAFDRDLVEHMRIEDRMLLPKIGSGPGDAKGGA